MRQDLSNQILKGAGGKVWFNGKRLANVKNMEAKLKAEYSDVKMCGDLSTGHALLGYDGSGDITLYKIDSDIAHEVAMAMKSGEPFPIKIITSMVNSKGKSERVEISDVVFEEIALANMSEKNLVEEKFPFKFSDFEYLDVIK